MIHVHNFDNPGPSFVNYKRKFENTGPILKLNNEYFLFLNYIYNMYLFNTLAYFKFKLKMCMYVCM